MGKIVATANFRKDLELLSKNDFEILTKNGFDKNKINNLIDGLMNNQKVLSKKIGNLYECNIEKNWCLVYEFKDDNLILHSTILKNNENLFTGYIMRKDKIVSTVVNSEIVEINDYAPIYIKEKGSFNNWLKMRSGDLNRSTMRLIRKMIGLPINDDIKAVIHVHGASVTDCFWIKKIDSNLNYTDITFKNDLFFETALKGSNAFEIEETSTPELTNIGSFNKGWKLVNGKWKLYKTGTIMEQFAEVFTSNLGILLGFDCIKYHMDGEFVVCDNFINDDECFEPMESYVGDDDNYLKNYNILRFLGIEKEYLNIIFLDAVIRNPDRHTQNYGVITSGSQNIKMAPNFDNNLALFAHSFPTNFENTNTLIEEFNKLVSGKGVSFPVVNNEVLKKAYDLSAKEFENLPENLEDIVTKFCLNHYSKIKF